MAAFLIFCLLFFLPLIVIPIGISPFETPKVVLAEILIDILLVNAIIQAHRIHLKSFYHPQIIFVGILFILSLDTQLLFHPQEAFFGNIFRLQGQFLLWHLLIFALLSKHISLYKIPSIYYYLSFVFLILGTLLLGVRDGRAFGTLGEPNALSATILFILPFVFFKFKPLRLVTLLTAFLLILLTGSRAGLVGLIIELIFIFKKSVAIPAILILLSLILPFIASAGWFENRAEIWQTAFMAGLKSPFIGHGFGNIQSVLHKEAVFLNNNVQYQIVDSSHNFLLDFWIQGGFVGVISILILIFLTFQHLIIHKKLLETTAFLGLLTAMLFNPVSVVNLLAFWWLIGYNHSA